MKDREFLIWLYHRIVSVYGENPYNDYLYRLRDIIVTTTKNKNSQGAAGADFDQRHEHFVEVLPKN